MAIRGSCLCGTLRYEIDGPITGMGNCHCSRCRKVHGAPFNTFVITTPAALRWIAGEDKVVSYAVAPGGPRHFCGTCGAMAPNSLPEHNLAFVPAGTLDDDPGSRPESHVFVGSKAAWHEIADALPRYDAYPPEFGDVPGLPDREVAPVPGKTLGSCLCGEVTYELSGAPVAMFQCHCSRCRKSRSAAHGANVFYNLADFRWTHGEELVTEYRVAEARFFAVAFCRQCGSAVPRPSVERGIVVVPASGLDTDPGIRPMAHIFVGSKAPWFEIQDSIPQYPEGPPSFRPAPAAP